MLLALEDEEIARRSRDPMLDAISDHFRVAPESAPPPAPGDFRAVVSSVGPLLRFPRAAGGSVDPDASE